MSFSVDNGFSLDVTDDVDIHRSDGASLQSSGNSSTPLSGESARRSRPRCHGRMSSFSLDRHRLLFVLNVLVSEALFCLCRGTNIYNFLGCARISRHVPRLFILFNFS